MSIQSLQKLIQDIHQISGVTLRLCDKELHTILLIGDETPLPKFRILPHHANLTERFITSQGDFLLLGVFSDQKLQNYLIAGPCQTASLSLANVIHTALNGSADNRIHDNYVKIPPIDLNLATAKSKSDAELLQRYRLQNKLFNMIKYGDTGKLAPIINQFFQTSGISILMNRIPNRRLRSEKNILYILNTTCRIAAELGHVSPIILDRVSEHYALIIEEIITTKTFQQLATRICHHYCNLVAAQRDNRYSRPVNQTIQFILRHYQQNLTLPSLALNAQVTPNHLSYIFKQETGETIFTFINRYRIQIAQSQLHHQNSSMMDIAFQAGFNNVTYFNKVFKRYTGLTPSDFLKRSYPTLMPPTEP